MAQMYLQMGKLILAAVCMIFVLFSLQLLLDEGIDWIRDTIDGILIERDRRRSYQRLAKKHGRRISK